MMRRCGAASCLAFALLAGCTTGDPNSPAIFWSRSKYEQEYRDPLREQISQTEAEIAQERLRQSDLGTSLQSEQLLAASQAATV